MSKTVEVAETPSADAPGPPADRQQGNRLTGPMVQAMRLSLGVTVAELAKTSGVLCSSLEAMERGTATTATERRAISTGFAWLLNDPRPTSS
jgi:DNA-binding XRE family transcriptional regulator